MTKDNLEFNCTYDQALNFRKNLMGVDAFSPEKWEAVRLSYGEYEVRLRQQLKVEKRIVVAEWWAIGIAVLVGSWLGLKGQDGFGIALIFLTMGAACLRRAFLRKTFKHKLSAFGPSDFKPVAVADYDEVWRMASNNRIVLEYVTKALAHRGELLDIELVDLRHHDYERRVAAKLEQGEKTKALLSSKDPKVKAFLTEQIAAVEFYRDNPTVALIDRRKGAQAAGTDEPSKEGV